MAFVQSPQEYRVWEGSAFYRACHTGFAYFFVVGMISRSYRNSIIFAGTMGLIRRSALEAVGGWDEAIITEDAETSLRMLARGGRGIYVPQAFGRGIMPLTYEAMRGQRFRWAFGGIQILRKHWRSLLPWSRSGLNQRQRRDYLLGGLWWFNDAMTLGFTFYVAATAIGFLAHRPFVVQRLYGLGIVLPLLYLALGLIRYLWGLRAATGVSLREALDAMRVNLSLSWVVTLACVRGLIEKRGVFLRTPKFRGGFQAFKQLRVVWAETLFAVASIGLAIWVFLASGFSVLTLSLDSLLLWAAIVYGSATTFALGDPERPPESLRRKALLELAPTVGTVIRSGVRIGILTGLAAAIILIAVVVAGESGRTPIQGGPGGALPQSAQGSSPPASSGPGVPTPAASAGKSISPSTPTPPSATAPPATPAPTPAATPQATQPAASSGPGAS